MVNALSEWINIEIWRGGKVYVQGYKHGVPTGPLEMTGHTDRRGTKVSFKPDDKIFETNQFSFDVLSQRLRELAFLNRGLLITIEDERDEKKHEFHYTGGIISFVEHLNKNKEPLHDKVIYFEGVREGIDLKIAMQYNDGNQEQIFTFANNINTHEGGTHMIGFKSALTRTLNNYAFSNNLFKEEKETLSGDDVREGLVAVISVKLPKPQFEGQTKTKLGNSEVTGIVETLVNVGLGDYLTENPSVAKKVVSKAIEASRALEAALSQSHHHDGCRRRRIAHPDAPADVFLSSDESTDRAGQHLHRTASALQGEEGQERAVHQGRAANVAVPAEEGDRESRRGS